MTKRIAYVLIGLLLTVYCFAAPSPEVSNENLASKHIDFLQQKQQAIKNRLQVMQSADELSTKLLTQKNLLTSRELAENKRSLALLNADIDDRDKLLVALKKQVESPTRIPDEQQKHDYAALVSLQVIKKQELGVLEKNTELLETLHEKEKHQLMLHHSEDLVSKKKASIEENKLEATIIRKKLSDLLDKKMSILNSADLDEASRQSSTELYSIEQDLLEIKLNYLTISQRLFEYSDRYLGALSLPAIQQQLNGLSELANRINTTLRLLNNTISHLSIDESVWTKLYKQGVIAKSTLKSIASQQKRLRQEANASVNAFSALKTDVALEIKRAQKEKSKWVSLRQGLLSLSSHNVEELGHSIFIIPSKMMLYAVALSGLVKSTFETYSFLKQLGFLTLLSVMVVIWIVGHRLFQGPQTEEEERRLSKNIYLALLGFLKRNWSVLCSFAALMIIFLLIGLTFQAYRLVVMLYVTWFSYRMLLSLTRLTLLENMSQVDGHDVALYHRLRVAFIIGGLITASMVLSRELAISSIAVEFFSRLFMVFLFAVSIVLLRAREVILVLFKSLFHTKRFYIERAMKVLLVLGPLALMLNALIGMSGFMVLAWEMAYYFLVFVLSVSAYVIVRGVVNDFIDIFAEFLIKQSKNGWFWGEAFLKPFSRLVNLILKIGLVASWFYLFGLSEEEKALTLLVNVWQFHLFRFSKANITVGSFIEFTFLVFLFIWMTKWTRECCYRWFYRYIKDLGIRNSFAAFTQYAVVTIGTIITLRVLGVDISGVSVILGGLAVGMGFGLRDFANNIVGGLMLLIERPVKEGDLISIDNTEGRVMHIGIRSMRVRSWDHMEVLIPNSETFSKPFTNWTHQDTVVRTVITIKVSREDSATKVQQLIMDVLAIIPEVLDDPEPQVYLKHIDEALLEFEVRYFINLEEHSRMKVRSIVLFAITAQFRATGIKSPIPPISIEGVVNPCK